MTTAAEDIKQASRRLRGDLVDELAGQGASFSAEAGIVLKFHGIYQQDDRDLRRERTRASEELAYSSMVRCSVPGGVLQPEQWAAIDRLADEVADGSLRLTSRQGVQFHFVHKGDLKNLVASLNRELVTTYAACGDVVRNIMVTAAPDRGRDLAKLNELAQRLAARLKPQSSAYWELWLDGERAVSASADSAHAELANADSAHPKLARGEPEEPLYGERYLPRKFKIGIAWPGDNSIDVYSQDVGLVPLPNELGEPGAVVVAGGGLGRSHTDETTFARLGDPLGWVPEAEIGETVETIVAIFRDEGNRDDRSHARLKYLVHERGIGWLREEVEARVGRRLAEPVALPPWTRTRHYLGWHQQEAVNQDGKRWYLGVPVPSGRLGDGRTDGVERRQAVREILATYATEIRLTPQQDLLLCGIKTEHKAAVESILEAHAVPLAHDLSLTVVSSMACPALPTCGQALGEAERILPELVELIDGLLAERGLDQVPIETRITGCPNGCSRPYVAELGLVGRTKTAYDIFVGGDPSGTRLAELAVESVPFLKLGDVLGPLLDRYRAGRIEGEPFGDWANRLGVPVVSDGLPTFARGAGDGR